MSQSPTSGRRVHTRRLTLGVAAGLGAVAVLATAAPAGATVPAPGDGGDFCTAVLAAESAPFGDPAGIGPAFAAVEASAPDELAAAVEAMLANAPEGPGPLPPEYVAARAEVMAWVTANCGYAELGVVAADYSFGGIQPEVAAGPTIVTLENTGTELHEIVLVRKNAGVTESFDELLALPEEEADAKVTFVGVAIADPTQISQLVVDLVPGDYLAICFIPVGTTPEVLAEAGDSLPMGEPHFLHGMKQEFTVAGDGAQVSGSTAAGSEAPSTTSSS